MTSKIATYPRLIIMNGLRNAGNIHEGDNLPKSRVISRLDMATTYRLRRHKIGDVVLFPPNDEDALKFLCEHE